MSAAEIALQQQLHALYSEHHGWLQGWLRGKLGDAHQAADLAHDTFIRLLVGRRAKASDGWGREPRALLTHIAKGLVIDHWRHQEVERAYLDAVAHLPEQLEPSPESRLIIMDALMRIDAMLSRLPSRTREIFLLAQLDGLTLQQIADCTHLPVITVRRHIQKALLACMAVV